MLLRIALSSLLNRKTTVLLTAFSIAISVSIVLAVEHIRHEMKNSFTHTLSGTDLVVGARAGRINLLLYSVFRIGNATNNISWQSYQKIARQKGVKWTIPISLGDSHRGYRVVGTNQDYFTFYGFGQKQSLELSQGTVFKEVYDVVLGAEVAKKLQYELGQKIILSHGIGSTSLNDHDDKPFTVVGILKRTGTPVDHSLHVPLEGIEAIHIDWRNGAPIKGLSIDAQTALTKNLQPKSITAFLLGLDNRILTFRLQRQINQYRGEPLQAILPGIALSELWQSMNMVEKTLAFIAALVVSAALLGMTTMILATLKQRQREFAVLRATGASAWFIVALIELETITIAAIGTVVGISFLWGSILIAQPWISEYYGVYLNHNILTPNTGLYAFAVIGISAILAIIPATLVYKQSLAQGLTVKE